MRLSVLAILCVALPLFAADKPADVKLYVSPAGNDDWSGRLAAPNERRSDGPVATPARARDLARKLRADGEKGPITILLRGGRYELSEPLTFTPADSGTAAGPLRFLAYPDEKPILSGGRKITGWKEGRGGVWSAEVPKTLRRFRYLAVGGATRFTSRLPREGTYSITGLAGADPKAKYNTPADRFEFAEGQLRSTWANLAEVEVVVLHFWVDGHYRVQSIDDKARVVTLDRKSRRRFTETGSASSKPGRFYVRNVREALQAGDFYHDAKAGTVSYLPVKGEDVSKAVIVASQLDAVVVFAGKPEDGKFVEHVELQGLTLSDTTWEPAAKDAADAQAASTISGGVRLRGARRCALLDCTLTRLGGYGIELGDGCRHNRLVGNELAHLGAGGIKLSGGAAGSKEALRTGENVLSDNHLYRLGEHFHCGVGILLMHADNNRVAHNHVHHLYYTAISAGWVWGYADSVSRGNRIEHNHLHDVGQGLLSDMGGVYLLGKAPGTVVRHNVIHDVDSFDYGGWGIYTDEGSSEVLIEKNLVYRTKSGGFHQHYGKDNVVRNNIFALARTEQVARSRQEQHTSFTFERNVVYYRQGKLFGGRWGDDKVVLRNNLYFQADGKPIVTPLGDWKQWQAKGYDKGSQIADPRFHDPDKGDFTLREGSPALKLGFEPFDVKAAGPRPLGKRGE